MHEKMDIFYLTSKKTANIYRTIYPTAHVCVHLRIKRGSASKARAGWLLHIFLWVTTSREEFSCTL